MGSERLSDEMFGPGIQAPTIDQARRAAAVGAATLEEIHLVRDPQTGRTRIEVVSNVDGKRWRAATSGYPHGDGRMLAELMRPGEPLPHMFASGQQFYIQPDPFWRVFVDLEFRQDGEARFEWNEIGRGEEADSGV